MKTVTKVKRVLTKYDFHISDGVDDCSGHDREAMLKGIRLLSKIIEEGELKAFVNGYKKGQVKGILDCTYGQRTIDDLQKEDLLDELKETNEKQ